MVKYQIQYKPPHPVTGKPVTGRTDEEFTGNSDTTGTDYDMFFMYTRSSFGGYFGTGDIQKIEKECWAVYSNENSLKQAIVVARPLIARYGVDNVQICKVAPISTEIVFEEK